MSAPQLRQLLRAQRSEALRVAIANGIVFAACMGAQFAFLWHIPSSLLVLIPAAILGVCAAVMGSRASSAVDAARLATRDLKATSETRL